MVIEPTLVNIKVISGGPFSLSREATRPDWDVLDPALHGDLSATCAIPAGGHRVRDYPAIPGAPGIRIIVGELPREGML
jgi:hypothetical protein